MRHLGVQVRVGLSVACYSMTRRPRLEGEATARGSAMRAPLSARNGARRTRPRRPSWGERRSRGCPPSGRSARRSGRSGQTSKRRQNLAPLQIARDRREGPSWRRRTIELKEVGATWLEARFRPGLQPRPCSSPSPDAEGAPRRHRPLLFSARRSPAPPATQAARDVVVRPSVCWSDASPGWPPDSGLLRPTCSPTWTFR
jgi:hypothetical protein